MTSLGADYLLRTLPRPFKFYISCSELVLTSDYKSTMADTLDTGKATADVLNQTLDEYGNRIGFNGVSKILVSDANIAKVIFKATEYHRTSHGPHITVASRGQGSESSSDLEGIADVKPLESLEMDYYTHTVWGLAGEDPKTILEGFKWMIYALRPKGIAIVTSPKLEGGKTEGDEGQLSIGLEERMLYQSKGKIGKLSDVLEYAGFERGKIRSQEKTTEAGGEKVEVEVVLAMKWDQLTG